MAKSRTILLNNLWALCVLLCINIQAQTPESTKPAPALIVPPQHRQLVDKIVAQVDDKIILLSEIEEQYGQTKSESKNPLPSDFRCTVLEGLLTQKLLVAQAILDSIDVKDDEVENELDNRLRYYEKAFGGEEAIVKFYGKPIAKIKDEFRDEIKQHLLAEREQQSIIKDVQVTPSEVNTFYKSIPKDSLPYYNAQVVVGVLIIKPKVSPELKELARQSLLDLKARIQKGEDFAKLAGVYSEDPGSRDNGGDLGYLSRTDLDPGFAGAAFRLKNPGEMSDVVESKFGFHLIQMVDRRGELIRVRHILIRPKTVNADLMQANRRVDSIRDMILKDSITFTKAVYKYSEDDNTKNNGGLLVNQKTGTNIFETGDLDKDIFFVVDTMKPGGVSRAQYYKNEIGESCLRLIYLKSESKPHQMNMVDDYDKIQELSLTRKKNDKFQKWLGSHRSITYIHIDDMYSNCAILKDWFQPSKPKL